jgi:hypothetical protein
MAHFKKEMPSRVYGAIFKVLFMRQQFIILAELQQGLENG